jgi:general secretion pathway protein K
MLALLAVLSLGFASGARTELQIARNQYESARARAIAEVGVSLAILGLLQSSAEAPWPVDGQERVLAFGDGSIRVRVQDEAGKIDLNAAPGELLAGLFQTLGAEASDSLALARSLVAWREARLSRWAAAAPNQRVVRAAEQRFGPFLAVEELRLVPGVTRALYARAAPYVTVLTRRPRIDPLTAPAAVLRSIPGMDPRQVDAYLAARMRATAGSGEAPPALIGGQAHLARSPLRFVTVTSEGRTANGAVFVREAAVEITRGPGVPYRLLSWRQGWRDDDRTQAEE